MKNKVLLRCKRTRWYSVIRDSSIQRGGGPGRHSRVGGNPQGVGEVESPSPLMGEESKVRVKQDKPTESPSPLMGEESKVRVNKTTPTTPARHCGLDPQSRGAGQGDAGETRQHNLQNPPLP